MPKVSGLEPLIEPGRILLLGELHGTAEVPRFVVGVACLAISADQNVTVLLEIPREEIGRTSAFLDSSGTIADKKALLAGDFWQRSFQDGRSSEAILELLDTIRRWRHSGYSVRLALIDSEPVSGQAREETMARLFLRAIETSPNDFFVSLTGNIHNRLTETSIPGGGALRPMAQILAESLPHARMTSLNIKASGGMAWYCTDECGVKKIRSSEEEGEVPRIVLESSPSGKAFHGRLYIGKITASMPAVPAASPMQ